MGIFERTAFHRRPLSGDGKIIHLCALCVPSGAGGEYLVYQYLIFTFVWLHPITGKRLHSLPVGRSL